MHLLVTLWLVTYEDFGLNDSVVGRAFTTVRTSYYVYSGQATNPQPWPIGEDFSSHNQSRS